MTVDRYPNGSSISPSVGNGHDGRDGGATGALSVGPRGAAVVSGRRETCSFDRLVSS